MFYLWVYVNELPFWLLYEITLLSNAKGGLAHRFIYFLSNHFPFNSNFTHHFLSHKLFNCSLSKVNIEIGGLLIRNCKYFDCFHICAEYD